MKKKHPILKLILFLLTCVGLMALFNELAAYFSTRRGLLDSDGSFFDWNGRQIYYKKTGSGKPLILLHDLTPASSGREWSKVVKRLSGIRTVYTIDLPGCARSARGADDYVGYFYIQFLRAFSADVIGEQADIAATGTSAFVALSAAGYDPELAGRLILVNPGANANYRMDFLKGKAAPVISVILRIPVFGTFLYNVLYSKAALNRIYIDRLFYNPYRVEDKLVEETHEAAHLSKGRGKYLLSSFLNGDMAIDPSLALDRIDQPMLLVFGSAEAEKTELQKVFEKKAEEDSSDSGKLTKIVTIPDSAHFPQIEEPEAFADIAESFLLG